jgi:hypothetical protein
VALAEGVTRAASQNDCSELRETLAKTQEPQAISNVILANQSVAGLLASALARAYAFAGIGCGCLSVYSASLGASIGPTRSGGGRWL